MPTVEELSATVETLSKQMKRLVDDRSIGAAIDGKFSLKWPTRIQGPNGDAYIIVRKSGGRLETVKADVAQKSDWVDDDTYDFMPIGTIWAYAGTEADVPTGWQLCDGTNGTYDLRDNFILGGAYADIGTQTTGASTVIADHSNHAVTQPNDHALTTGAPSANTAVQSGAGTVVAANNHTHGQTLAHAGAAVDAHSAHSVTTDYTPPSYTLAFIQRVS